jgi:hypothetical protein
VAEIVVVERALVGAASEAECADVLVLAPRVAGVVDGATAKPWDDPNGPDGRTIALTVAARLAGLGPATTGPEAVRAVTEDVGRLLDAAGIRRGAGSAASFAVVHLGSRQVWRVGEAHVLVNGRAVPARPTGEEVVAAARALVLRSALAAGADVERLRADDPGRAAVRPLLRALVELRNRPVAGYRNAAVDGREVPPGFLDVVDLPGERCEVVVATDGYPSAAPSLAEAERLLAERLAADPLMIGEPPATKGWTPGKRSFDDRGYLRLVVPGRDEGDVPRG